MMAAGTQAGGRIGRMISRATRGFRFSIPATSQTIRDRSGAWTP